MLGRKNNSISRTAVFLLASVFALAFTSGAQAEVVVDFAQGANAHNTVGDVYWIRGILQQNNSIHYEGMSTLQRVLFLDIPATPGHVHTLTLKHQANKSTDNHAYDFITSWDQAVDAANAIGGPGLFVTINECGPKIGPPNDLDDICADLHATGHTAYFDVPDAMGYLLGDDVAARVAAYEAIFGNRTVKIYGEAPFSGLSMSFEGYSGSTDMYADYTLTWTSASTSIVIEMAGHLAAGVDPLAAGIGYGEDRGSANISGGPYHFKLEYLDDISLGSQDNQIKGADILIPPPVCEAFGDEVCVGEDATLTGSASGGDPGSYQYCWTKDDPTGPCIGTTANLVIANAQLSDAGTYYFIVCDQYHCATETCEAVLIVHDAPVCEALGDEVCAGHTATLMGSASGGDPGSYTYCWKKDLAGDCIGTSANLVIPNAQVFDAGIYYFIVDDQYHCAPDTCPVELIVHDAPICDAVGDEVCEFDDAMLSGTAYGGDPGSYQYCWKKDLAGPCLSTTTDLVIPDAQLTDAGTYCFIVNDQYGCAPDTCCVQLIVHGSPMCDLDGGEVCAGEDFEFIPNVTGGDPGSYEYCWKRDLAGPCIGTGPTLPISNAQLSDAGTYYLIVDDQYHCCPYTCQAELIVHDAPVCEADGDEICAGQEATLTSSVSGGDPGSYTYCWKKDLAGGCIGTSANLVIPNAQLADAGIYYFIVDDQYHCAPDTCQAELVVGDPECDLDCPDPPPICGSTGNTLTVTTSGPFPIVDYQWSLTNTGWMITGGQGTPTITYTAGSALSATFTVVVTDELGCKDTCEIVCDCEPGEYCTYTMGGWGSECPESQQGDLMSTQPGCIRDHYFSDVFPEGVVIGDPDGPGSGANWYAALWTSASAVEAFLPAGETPGALTADLTNPVSTPAGVLAGQILALRLNVEYSCAGVFADLDLPGVGCYGGFTIPDTCGGGKFDGMSVNAFLAIADSAVGGLDVLGSYSATYSDLNYTATCLNELFDNCNSYVPEPFATGGSTAKSSADETDASVSLPKEFSLSQSYPNPFNPSCVIAYALPTDCHVSLNVYNMLGQKVKVLVDEYQTAGHKSATWDGKDANGRELTTGIYFYRLQAGDFVQSKKMVFMK